MWSGSMPSSSAREHLKGYMAVRDQFIGDPPPASTLMIVSGFSRPEFLVEIEVIAAGPRRINDET